MSTTTTSHSPESEDCPETDGRDAADRRTGVREVGVRGARVIRNEATIEIPVHLLFRDEPEPESERLSVPLGPEAVRRRRDGGAPVRARQEGQGRQGVQGVQGKESQQGQQGQQEKADGDRPRIVRRIPAPPRPGSAPEADPDLVERPARVLPGTAGVLAGAVGATGCVLASWWAGVLPPLAVAALGLPARPGAGLGGPQWATLAGCGALGLFGFGGLARGRTGCAWVLGLFGRYRGTVRRTGLMWVNPLLLRRRIDVRLRHWRSEAMPAVDADGVALRVVVLVVWRVRDTARAALGVEDHQRYLRECVEAALARVLAQRPVDVAPHVWRLANLPPASRGADRGILRNTEAVSDSLTRLVAADAAAAGLQVFSAQPVCVEYAPEIAAVMQRRRIAALDAQYRDTVLTSVVDSVEDTVTRLTVRGLVELDDYERKALVKDLTVAFYTGHGDR